MMEGTSLYLPVVILLMQCSPSVPVTVSTDKHRVEVREFSDAVLSCTFRTEKDQNPRIEWKKKGKDVSFVYFDGHFRGPFEDRATIDGATVTLKRVTQEDAGEYRCEISAPLDTVNLGETNVTLKVLVPPHTPSCEIPSGAVTGSVVQLRCRDQQSIPPATYSWFKDNLPIQQPRHANATYLINSHTGVLEFKAVAKEDTGRYSCLASNRVGPPKMCEGKHMTIGHFGSPRVTVQPTSAAKPCTDPRTRPMSTTSLRPKNPRTSNTPSPSCSEQPAFPPRTHQPRDKGAKHQDSLISVSSLDSE
ncbi:junctional adhesion molecule 2A isoform 3-T4 [Lycodopsis pacificus]